MGKIIEASELPLTEEVYLKHDFLGWRVVQPIVGKNGQWNYLNLLFGGKRGFFFLVFLIAFILGIFFYMDNQVTEYKIYCEEISVDPVAFCDGLGYYEAIEKAGNTPRDANLDFNFTRIKGALDDSK